MNVISFELNWFNASIWFPGIAQDALIEAFKSIRNKLHYCTYSSISVKSLHRLALTFLMSTKIVSPKVKSGRHV